MQAGGPPEAELDLTWAPCRRPCRVWYMNGNYLVILVSVSVILPLALMRQLGEHVAGPWGCGQQAAAHSPPPSPHRLPGLLQRLLPQLHGVLPHRCESTPAPVRGGSRVGRQRLQSLPCTRGFPGSPAWP